MTGGPDTILRHQNPDTMKRARTSLDDRAIASNSIDYKVDAIARQRLEAGRRRSVRRFFSTVSVRRSADRRRRIDGPHQRGFLRSMAGPSLLDRGVRCSTSPASSSWASDRNGVLEILFSGAEALKGKRSLRATVKRSEDGRTKEIAMAIEAGAQLRNQLGIGLGGVTTASRRQTVFRRTVSFTQWAHLCPATSHLYRSSSPERTAFARIEDRFTGNNACRYCRIVNH